VGGYPCGRVPLWEGTLVGEGYPCGRRVPLWEKGTLVGEGYPCGRRVPLWEKGTLGFRVRYRDKNEDGPWSIGVGSEIQSPKTVSVPRE